MLNNLLPDSEIAGSPIRISNFSQLFEEFTKTSNELYNVFVSLQDVFKVELLSNIEAGKRAVQNAASPDISDAERTILLERGVGEI
jgi:hypothetical protein